MLAFDSECPEVLRGLLLRIRSSFVVTFADLHELLAARMLAFSFGLGFGWLVFVWFGLLIVFCFWFASFLGNFSGPAHSSCRMQDGLSTCVSKCCDLACQHTGFSRNALPYANRQQLEFEFVTQAANSRSSPFHLVSPIMHRDETPLFSRAFLGFVFLFLFGVFGGVGWFGVFLVSCFRVCGVSTICKDDLHTAHMASPLVQKNDRGCFGFRSS